MCAIILKLSTSELLVNHLNCTGTKTFAALLYDTASRTRMMNHGFFILFHKRNVKIYPRNNENVSILLL